MAMVYGLHSVILLVLTLHRAALALASQLRRSKRKHMSITVKWGREKLHLPLPSPDAKLASLRESLAEHTALPPSSFKLIHAGAIMKDDNATLATYGIRPNSSIALIGGHDKPLPKPPVTSITPAGAAGSRKKKPAGPATEESTIATIRAELASVHDTIEPSLNKFLDAMSNDDAAAAPQPAPSSEQTEPIGGRVRTTNLPAAGTDDLEFEHARLGELLLQSLLRLDVLNMDGAWTEARKERKSAVKEVQFMLDKLDGGWKSRGLARNDI